MITFFTRPNLPASSVSRTIEKTVKRLVYTCCFFALLLTAEAEKSAKKRVGYTGAGASEIDDDDSAAAVKAKTAKSTASAKKKAVEADDEPAASTPAPAKKKAPAKAKSDDDDDAEPAPSRAAKSETETLTPTKKKTLSKTKSDDAEDPTPAPSRAAENKAETPAPAPAAKAEHAANASVEIAEIADFAAQPEAVQKLITAALELTKRNLTYTYGSADPANGGLDCSGTIYYLLRAAGFSEVPRDSSGQYAWARQADTFRAVVSKSGESFEFDDLLPGDLLFWSGTYQVQREIPISHVMLYLGKEKRSGKRIMFGASDGRSYNGVQRWGVSVFDFKMPRAESADGAASKVDFVGYGRIPGLRVGEHSRKPENAAVKPETAKKESAKEVADDEEESAASTPKAPTKKTAATAKKKRAKD